MASVTVFTKVTHPQAMAPPLHPLPRGVLRSRWLRPGSVAIETCNEELEEVVSELFCIVVLTSLALAANLLTSLGTTTLWQPAAGELPPGPTQGCSLASCSCFMIP
ncbi:hypothetical protein U9M48_041177 [Paspalum notatum var. saurae]|uniref:Uncharacterized protein n=1 Tax=Paspalum notatum var. saurae TaxID=547442 RepID=A0AAQ3UTX6_PASNO